MSKKIVHVCMCGPVTDGWTYQDNLLPKYHKRMGLEVTVITSEWIWDTDGKVIKDTRSEYLNEFGIKVLRLPIKANKTLSYKFKRYPDLVETIKRENPDILFIHGCQFLDIWKIKEYLKNTNICAFLDNHADFSNSGTNFLSKEILHKRIWRAGARAIEPYISRFYGVLPARVDFLRYIYKLPEKKIELLVMGADDDKVQENEKEEVKNQVRKELLISLNDFVIITGGKIDYAKRQTLLLMQAIKEIDDENIILLIFGSVEDDIKEEFDTLCDSDKRIINLGWQKAEDTYKYFAISDLAVFPGRHSVIWEQAVGQGIPIICKYWDGTTHVDVGGNARFIKNDNVETIKQEILEARANYSEMNQIAKNKAKYKFQYGTIAKESIR